MLHYKIHITLTNYRLISFITDTRYLRVNLNGIIIQTVCTENILVNCLCLFIDMPNCHKTYLKEIILVLKFDL